MLFSYWTEPAKLTQWWPEDATLEAVRGGEYRYSFPKVDRTLTGTFTEVVRGKRLAFSWTWEHENYEQQVVVDLERRDEDTLLTVTHGPYSAKGDEAEGLEGWTHFLGRLKRSLEPA